MRNSRLNPIYMCTVYYTKLLTYYMRAIMYKWLHRMQAMHSPNKHKKGISDANYVYHLTTQKHTKNNYIHFCGSQNALHLPIYTQRRNHRLIRQTYIHIHAAYIRAVLFRLIFMNFAVYAFISSRCFGFESVYKFIKHARLCIYKHRTHNSCIDVYNNVKRSK